MLQPVRLPFHVLEALLGTIKKCHFKTCHFKNADILPLLSNSKVPPNALLMGNWWCLCLTFVLNQSTPEQIRPLVGDRDEVPEQVRELRFVLERTPDTSTTTLTFTAG